MKTNKLTFHQYQRTEDYNAQSWQVPSAELKQALDSEIAFFEEQLEASTQSSHRAAGKAVLRPEDIANLSGALKDELHWAERAMAKAEQYLERVAAMIEEHNATLANTNLGAWALRFHHNHQRATELLHMRGRALRRYRRCKAHLESILVAIGRQQQERNHALSGDEANNQQMHQLFRHRQMAILHNYQRTELDIRRQMRDQLDDIHDQQLLNIYHHNLDETVSDLRLHSQIRSLSLRLGRSSR